MPSIAPDFSDADHLGIAQRQRAGRSTICDPSVELQPTSQVRFGIVTERPRSFCRLKPNEVAAAFLAWAREHRTPGANGQEIAVDDLYWIASTDFAPANDIAMPPRRVFLGQLKRLQGVKCTRDRRVYDKDGKLKCKTTFYEFTDLNEFAVAEALATKLAA
jgi:hypothetical protein